MKLRFKRFKRMRKGLKKISSRKKLRKALKNFDFEKSFEKLHT